MTVVGKKGRIEEVDAYGRLREEAAHNLAAVEENLEDATVLVVPSGRYGHRAHTMNMTEPLIERVRLRPKSNPDLHKRRLGLPTDWRRAGRETR